MQIGFLGLGKMGVRMAEKLLAGGHTVVVWNRTADVTAAFVQSMQEKQYTVSGAATIAELAAQLASPKIFWLMVPAGDATQTLFDEVMKQVAAGDIVVDGGNAFYKDTEVRSAVATEKGVRFLGIGVSGGVLAAQNGYPLMAGGDKSAFAYVTPLLETLAKPHGGYDYFGEKGAGHFVKMVHNGIEYSIMQGLGEGFGVLEKAPYQLDLLKIANLYQKGTLVSGFMLDRAYDALAKNHKLDDITGVIDATGEALWTVNQGKEEGVVVENIEQTLVFRRRSKTDPKVSASFAARMVAALRREFGGHAVAKIDKKA